MWNLGASCFSPATSPTPSPTCTNTASSTTIVNHHRARVRRAGNQFAPSAHAPASPLPMMTNQAQPLWMSRSSCAYSRRWLPALRRHASGLPRLGLGVGLGGDVDELHDLVVAEPGQPAEVAGQVHRVLVLLAPEAAEAEQLVDRLLEVEGLLLALGIGGGEAPQPVRSHLHVGHLVGQHPVLAEGEHRVAER